jgi:hypothetical protein
MGRHVRMQIEKEDNANKPSSIRFQRTHVETFVNLPSISRLARKVKYYSEKHEVLVGKVVEHPSGNHTN